MKRNQSYVVQCIKGNNNRYGFGFRHKKGQYVTYEGRGTFNIHDSHIYRNNDRDSCNLDECDGNWMNYYQYVPIEIERRVVCI